MRRFALTAGMVLQMASLVLSDSQDREERKGQEALSYFGAEVNYVEVYAVVTDREGRFVSDLSRKDFDVYEDGKLQQVSRFTTVDIPVERASPVPFIEGIEPDVRTNTEGRVFVLVLDDLHTAGLRSHYVIQAASELIEEHMGTNDIAAVVHTSGRRDASQGFTSSKRLLRRAVRSFVGRKLDSATVDKLRQLTEEDNRRMPEDRLASERVYRARNTMHLLGALSSGLGKANGRRKAIVWFGEGSGYDVHGEIGGGSGGAHHAIGGARTILDSVRGAIEEATRANVTVYAIDPRGLRQSGDDSLAIGLRPLDADERIKAISVDVAMQAEFHRSQESLRGLAEETGGFALLNQNDFAPGLARLVEENSRYYLLGYEPSNTGRGGDYRKIDVRVTRPGLEVRARKGYFGPREEDDKGKAVGAPVPRGASPALTRFAESPLPLSGIPMRATAVQFRLAERKALVSLVVEVDIAGFAFEEKGGALHDVVELSAVAIDHYGRVQGTSRREFVLGLRPRTHQFMLRAGFRAMMALELPSGSHQLRIVASESGAGQGGSLFYDLEIPEYDNSELRMTPLVVTSALESRVPVACEETDKQKVGLLPATRRQFSRLDELIVLAEVYPPARSGPKPPVIEMAMAVRAMDGQAVFEAREERGGVEFTGRRAFIEYRVEVPLSGLAPEDYVIEVEARTLGGDSKALQRVLFEVF